MYFGYSIVSRHWIFLFFFFFNDTATTEIYTLSLHDALPILGDTLRTRWVPVSAYEDGSFLVADAGDRKSTRLNSSHANISYAVFCLKKKNNEEIVIELDPIVTQHRALSDVDPCCLGDEYTHT